jgi:ABC-type multidrug transport system fused ATPase/permease subunit
VRVDTFFPFSRTLATPDANRILCAAGLDVASRASISSLLSKLHSQANPTIILTLRPQDGIPEWVTHIVQTDDRRSLSYIGSRSIWEPIWPAGEDKGRTEPKVKRRRSGGDELVKLDGVNVSYGDRGVLKGVSWSIREGERWALKGHNGTRPHHVFFLTWQTALAD